MVNYLPGVAHLPICRSRSEKKKNHVNHNNNNITSLFENKLASQDKSVLNQTFTLDTNKEERCREFCIEDAINGFLPRARSSGPRSNMKNSKNDENVRSILNLMKMKKSSSGGHLELPQLPERATSPLPLSRVRSETASLFSSTCKLPLLDGSVCAEKKTCTIRPWSRTQDELRKFKETLASTTVSSSKASSN